jgi:trk system potassium uptake protein TrkA
MCAPSLLQRANDMLDVRAICENGAHPDVLERAGACDADILIAVTLHDEVNMVAGHVTHTPFAFLPARSMCVRSSRCSA